MNKRQFFGVLTLLCGSSLTWQTQAAPLFSWERLSDASVRAAREPSTWAPLAAATVIAGGHWDKQWQRSAGKHQYVFGQDAEDMSNSLLGASTLLYGVSMLMAAPPDQDLGEALEWKASNVGVLLADKALVDGIVGEWKTRSGRDRPDGVADDSFPSKHSATTATQTTLTRRNLDYIDMNPGMRQLAKVGLYGIDGLTGIARIEADKHYPTDILVGMALGNFLANFSYNLFLEQPAPESYSFSLLPTQEGLTLNTRLSF